MPEIPRVIAFRDLGGLVIKDPRVWLVYWGSAWIGGISPQADEITDAVSRILAGDYTSGLSQYRGIGSASMAGAITVSDSGPPNPFTNMDIASVIHHCLENGLIPEPDDDPSALFFVFLPPGVNSVQENVIGEHSYFTYFDLTDLALAPDIDMSNVHYGWVSNDGSIDYITTVFSHELVETCTDPNGDGIQGVSGVCTQDGWCEIGDVCNSSEVLDGVRVQSYWSQQDRACIVPGVAAAPDSPAPAIKAPGGAPPVTAPQPPTPVATSPVKGPKDLSTTSYAGGLLATAWLVPTVAAIVMVASYVGRSVSTGGQEQTVPYALVFGLGVSLAAWLILAALYRPMTSAANANPTSYEELEERLTQLDARIETLSRPPTEPTAEPTVVSVPAPMERR